MGKMSAVVLGGRWLVCPLRGRRLLVGDGPDVDPGPQPVQEPGHPQVPAGGKHPDRQPAGPPRAEEPLDDPHPVAEVRLVAEVERPPGFDGPVRPLGPLRERPDVGRETVRRRPEAVAQKLTTTTAAQPQKTP